MNKFIEIDVSKATIDVVILNELKESEWVQLPNAVKGFNQLTKYLDSHCHCIMEATGPYYYKLAYFLFNNGFKVSVENPLKIKRYCQMQMVRAKTDKKDAYMIAAYGMLMSPRLWQPEPKTIQQLKQKHPTIELLEKHSTALNNQLEAFSQLPVKDKSALKSIRELKRLVQKRIHKLESEMMELVNDHYQQTYKSLISIPGIGHKTAIALIAITTDFTKFNNYKQLISYVGLSPRIFNSGTSVKGKGRICKMGMGRIRKLLYLCAWSAKRYNKHCVEFYNRLKEKGKPERVIKIAIANKLLKQAFAIATNHTFFDNNFKNTFGY